MFRYFLFFDIFNFNILIDFLGFYLFFGFKHEPKKIIQHLINCFQKVSDLSYQKFIKQTVNHLRNREIKLLGKLI